MAFVPLPLPLLAALLERSHEFASPRRSRSWLAALGGRFERRSKSFRNLTCRLADSIPLRSAGEQDTDPSPLRTASVPAAPRPWRRGRLAAAPPPLVHSLLEEPLGRLTAGHHRRPRPHDSPNAPIINLMVDQPRAQPAASAEGAPHACSPRSPRAHDRARSPPHPPSTGYSATPSLLPFATTPCMPRRDRGNPRTFGSYSMVRSRVSSTRLRDPASFGGWVAHGVARR